MEPTSNKKPFADWDFDDLRDYAGWEIISGISRGIALSTIVYGILSTALSWKSEQDKKNATKKV